MTDVIAQPSGALDAPQAASTPYDATAKQKAQAKTARIPI